MRAIIRADDGELCGFVHGQGRMWRALSVFGGELAVHADEATAEFVVRELGLASLAERWLLTTSDGASDEQIVCIQEASPEGVTLALDYYSMPGVPTRRVTRDELDTGAVRLRRST